jgi:large subunit ribosomal protein L10
LPSEKILEKKKTKVKELAREFKDALVGILIDYKGLNVAEDTMLRRRMRESNVKYKVVKNTLLSRVFESAEIFGLEDFLVGSTAIALDSESYSNAAKILCDFSKNHDFYKIKAGFIEGKIARVEEIKAVAKLPAREQLISQVLCGLNSPIRAFACVLNGVPRALVIALNEICKNKVA